MKLLFLILVLLFQCAQQTYSWSNYPIKYVGSEQELTKTLDELKSKNFEYRVFDHKEGVYEIQYREIEARK
jgi:hypothetical protein